MSSRYWFLYNVTLQYSSPYDREEHNKAYHEYCERQHPLTSEKCQAWLRDHSDTSTKTETKLVAVDNPVGEGLIDEAIRRVIGEDFDLGEWQVIVRKVEWAGEVVTRIEEEKE